MNAGSVFFSKMCKIEPQIRLIELIFTDFLIKITENQFYQSNLWFFAFSSFIIHY
jgi:hypothetical protein